MASVVAFMAGACFWFLFDAAREADHIAALGVEVDG